VMTAVPATGYRFTNWTGTANTAVNPIGFTVRAPITQTAHFTLTCHTLTVAEVPPEGGAVTISPAPSCPNSQYQYGTSVQLAAAPAAGYAFGGWTGDVTGTTNPTSVAINANKSVTATFNATIVLDVSPAGETVTVGDIFTVELRALTGAQPVDTAHLVVGYNPALLQVVDAAGNPATRVISGTALPDVLTNTVNTSAGVITYAAGILEGQPPSGVTTIAYVRFRAIGPGPSQITYLPDSGLFFAGRFLGGARRSGSVLAVPVALRGIVTLEGRGLRGDPSWGGYPLTVTFGSGICATPTFTPTASHQTATDANGRFVIPDFLTGVFDVRAKNPHSLSSCRASLTIPTAGEIDFGLLLEGDVNNDDCVSAVDFSLLRTSYKLCKQDVGFNPNADLNGDGCVFTDDYSLLAKNYLLCGPISGPAGGTEQLAAGVATLSIWPANVTAAPGQEITLDLRVASPGGPVQAVDAALAYDPYYLEALAVTGEATMEDVLWNEVENATGVLHYTAGHRGTAPTGEFSLATVRFRLKSIPPGPLEIRYSAGTNAWHSGASVLADTQPAVVLPDPNWIVRSYLPGVMSK